MPLGSPVLLVTAFCALIATILIAFGLHHLRASHPGTKGTPLVIGMVALGIDLSASLALTLSIYLTPNESVVANGWLLPVVLLKQFAAMCWVGVMWQLMEKRAGRVLFFLPVFTAGLTLALVGLNIGAAISIWLIVAPQALALLVSAVLLLREGPLVPSIVMSGLSVVHLSLMLALPLVLVSSQALLVLVYVDLTVVLLTAVCLMLFTALWNAEKLRQQDQTMERVAQQARRLELQYSQAQKHESLGVLAGGIAHDFNNMLTSILGYTSLAMKNLESDSPVRKDLYMVMSGARQAVDLTSQMLAYAGKGAIEFQSIDVSGVVRNLAGLINSVVPGNIHLTQKLAQNLPMVRGDTVQLGQVVMNLVANAVDANVTPSGSIAIRTGLSDVDARMMATAFFTEELEPGAFVFIEVSDTGVGIAENQLERIFDPFYSDKNQSRGLGLSSLAGIVRQHQGFVSVRSATGVGSTMTIYLPVVTYADRTQFPPEPERELGTRERRRVLVADDDKRIRSLIVSVLNDGDYSVDEVEDGREALDRVSEFGASYDLIILDCTMPKLSGTDVYRQLRQNGMVMPVLLISGYRQEQVLHDIDHDVAAFFVKKPFAVDELLEQVEGALKNSRAKLT